MNQFSPIHKANDVLIQYFARSYLSENFSNKTFFLEGASVETRRIANRTNVPSAAVTKTHRVQHPELGFILQCRTVWFNGSLLHPIATHVVIEWISDGGGHESCDAITAANDWLQAVTP